MPYLESASGLCSAVIGRLDKHTPAPSVRTESERNFASWDCFARVAHVIVLFSGREPSEFDDAMKSRWNPFAPAISRSRKMNSTKGMPTHEQTQAYTRIDSLDRGNKFSSFKICRIRPCYWESGPPSKPYWELRITDGIALSP